MIAPEQRLLLVSDTGDDSEARRALARVGLDCVEGFLYKGMPAWIDAGLDFTRITQLSTWEVAERAASMQVLDVRSQQEWNSGHIEDATHIPLGELAERMGELSREANIVAVCGSGYRSSIAASLLHAHAFSNVRSMSGGMNAWNQRQWPTITG